MMKAIILSHERGGSYALDRNGCYQFVKGHTARPVGEEIELALRPQIQYAKIASIAAGFIMVVLLGSFSWLWNAESYSVYVDVNPSVELVFNNLNQLKAAKPLNEDGAKLLADLKLKGNPGDVV